MAVSQQASHGNKLRLVLADDHDLVREGLRRIIDNQDDMEVIGEAADGRAAVRLVAEMRPAILLVDVSMPGMDGMDVTRAVRAASPDAQVVGVTRQRDTHFLNAMLDAGAAGYVLKQSPSSELLQAIRSVAVGTAYIDSALPQRASAIPSRSDTALVPSFATPALDGAEWAVLDLVASAHSDGDIADRLSMSTVDVRAVKAAAMQKAGLRSRGQVVEFVRSTGRQPDRGEAAQCEPATNRTGATASDEAGTKHTPHAPPPRVGDI